MGFKSFLVEKLLVKSKGDEFWIDSSTSGIERMMNSASAGSSIKGSILDTKQVIIWEWMGHSEAYKYVSEMKPYAQHSLFNFYLHSVYESHLLKGRVSNVLETSASNDKGFSTEQKKIFPNISGKFSKKVISIVKTKMPFVEWVLFDDAIYDVANNKINKVSGVGGSWQRNVIKFFQSHGKP